MIPFRLLFAISKPFKLQQRDCNRVVDLLTKINLLFLFFLYLLWKRSFLRYRLFQTFFLGSRMHQVLHYLPSIKKKSLAHLKIVCYMTKTLKTPSPHMKVTRKDRLRIATHEGVQNLNLNMTIPIMK